MSTDSPLPRASRPRGTPLAVALSFALAACGGGGGSAGSPPPSPSSFTEPDGGHVHVNQAGYSTFGPKIATIVGPLSDEATFVLVDQDPEHTGDQYFYMGSTTLITTQDPRSGDFASHADFSSFITPGKYVLRVIVDPRIGEYWDSIPFEIKAHPLGDELSTLDWYAHAMEEPAAPGAAPAVPLATAAMKYFYYNRTDLGTERRRLSDIVPGYTENGEDRYWNFDLHLRPPSRANGDQTPAFLDWTDHKFNAKSYHWDAGDDAIYPVNTAFFDGLLMEMYEHYKGDLIGYGLNIPESSGRAGRSLPDLLSEVMVDAEAMASMLPPAGAKVNIAEAGGTPLRLAAHKIGYWNWYPWVGQWNPTVEAFCNFTPLSCSDPKDGSTCTSPCQSDDPDAPNSCQKPVAPPDVVKKLPDSCLLTGQDCLFPAAQGWYATHPAPAIPAETPDSKNWGGSAKARVAAGVYQCGSGPNPVYASKPSTAATFAVARYTAQLARLLQAEGRADWARYWSVAQDAFQQATRVPTVLWRNNGVDRKNSNGTEYTADKLEPYVNDAASPEKSKHRDYDGDGVVDERDYTTPRGSGPYEDDHLEDDQYAAAVQLYLTALAVDRDRVDTYRSEMINAPLLFHDKGATRNFFGDGWIGRFDWADVATPAQLSLLDAYQDGRLQQDPDHTVVQMVEGKLIPNLRSYADFLADQVGKQAYPSALPVDTSDMFDWAPGGYTTAASNGKTRDGRPDYSWGSNKHQTYGGIILLRAAEALPEGANPAPYRIAASRVMDYLLGTNPLGRSYITGFGRYAPKYVHHRAALFAKEELSSDPPVGWLVGGPMTAWRDCGFVVDGGSGGAEAGTPRFDRAQPWNPVTGANDGEVKTNRYASPVAGVTAPYPMRAMAPDSDEGGQKGWCSLEVTGDWNAGLAYFAFALQKHTATWGGF